MSDILSRVEHIFHELCGLDDGSRRDRLFEIGQAEPELRATLEGLLAADGALDDRLDRPVRDFILGDDSHGEKVPTAAVRPDSLPELVPPSGRYHIVETIGQGGMGVVYRVHDAVLVRDLAMKVIKPDDRLHAAIRPLDSGAAKRFMREARVLARLDHPGVVPIHDLGLDERGHPFFTMKLVQQCTLEDVLKAMEDGDTKWNRTRVLEILARVCEAIAYAHEKGVVHRDLKPSNIMVGSFGEVYVMDWGIAHVQEDPETSSTHSVVVADLVSSGSTERGPATRLTRHGDLLGTAEYMAPEQMKGAPIDPRIDVYALGAIIYRLLTGVPPYQDTDRRRGHVHVLAALAHRSPTPVHGLRSNVEPEVVAICEKAMARDPTQRYATMLELRDEVRAFLDVQVVKAYEAGALAELRKWVIRNRFLATWMAAALIALIGGGAISLFLYAKWKDKAAEASASASAATEQRNRAQEFAGIAEHDKSVAVAARRVADDQRAVAAHNERVANRRLRQMALRSAKDDIVRGDSDSAHSTLFDIPADMRGWEWQHLAHSTETPFVRGKSDTLFRVAVSNSVERIAGVQFDLSVYDACSLEKIVSTGTDEFRGIPRQFSYIGAVAYTHTRSTVVVAVEPKKEAFQAIIALEPDTLTEQCRAVWATDLFGVTETLCPVPFSDDVVAVTDQGWLLRFDTELRCASASRTTYAISSSAVAVDREGCCLVARVSDTAGRDGVGVLDLRNGKMIAHWLLPPGLDSFEVSNNGDWVACAFANGMLELRGSRDGAVFRRVALGNTDIRSVTLSITGDSAWIKLANGVVQTWALDKGYLQGILPHCSETIRSIYAVAGDRGPLLTTEEHILRYSNMGTLAEQWIGDASSKDLIVATGSVRKEIVSLAADGVVRFWDATSGHLERSLYTERSSPAALDYDDSAGVVVIGYRSGHLIAYDARSGARKWKLQAHDGSVARVRVLPAAKQVLSSGFGDCTRLWDLNGIEVARASIPRDSPPLTDCEVSDDGATVCEVRAGGIIRLLALSTLTEIAIFADPDAHAQFAVPLPIRVDSSEHFVMAGSYNKLRVWSSSPW